MLRVDLVQEINGRIDIANPEPMQELLDRVVADVPVVQRQAQLLSAFLDDMVYQSRMSCIVPCQEKTRNKRSCSERWPSTKNIKFERSFLFATKKAMTSRQVDINPALAKTRLPLGVST
jgi:hypothetical protein